MTTAIVPTSVPTCPDCKQELLDYKAEYCKSCHQEIPQGGEDYSWFDIVGGFIIVIGSIILGCFLVFPILSWIAVDDTTLIREYLSLAEGIFDKIKTIW